jgi:hypothetical protein
MDKVATMAVKDRMELFAETAARKRLQVSLIEKDFWVCWSLGRLFSLPKQPASMIFKGGTSLSKVFNIIRRFSEDVDLSLNREDLGFVGEKNPQEAPSGKKAQKLIAEISETCKRVIREELVPSIEKSCASIIGTPGDTWSIAIDEHDPQTVIFKYPHGGPAESSTGRAYIQPTVRLELGARSDHWPAEDHTVRSYAAEEFPALFEAPLVQVRTLAAERTFWEKATILHALHHRPIDKPLQPRLARHYYDLAQLYASPIGDLALSDIDLLASVVAHKRLFFPSGWANYDTANPGTLKLLPPPQRQEEIAKDYAAMREMMFDEPPSLEEVFQTLSTAEARING